MPNFSNVSPPGPPANEAVAEHYDSLDFVYRDLWGQHVHHGLWTTGRETADQATEAMSRRVLGGLALEPRARVASIGCGYGGTARIAAEVFGARVFGLTLSAAQKRHADTVPVARGAGRGGDRGARLAGGAAGRREF